MPIPSYPETFQCLLPKEEMNAAREIKAEFLPAGFKPTLCATINAPPGVSANTRMCHLSGPAKIFVAQQMGYYSPAATSVSISPGSGPVSGIDLDVSETNVVEEYTVVPTILGGGLPLTTD